MTTEWKGLQTFQDVAEAQAQGWEIEYRHMNKEHWQPWNHTWWNEDSFFRARPRQPKMKEVTSYCYRAKNGMLLWDSREVKSIVEYVRFPAGDIEGEVPDDH